MRTKLFRAGDRVGAVRIEADATWPGGMDFTVTTLDAGFEYRFKPGTLTRYQWLTVDLLACGHDCIQFYLELREAGADGRVFCHLFSILPHCQARMRMPLEAVGQGRLSLPREGAWIKPRFRGQRVELARVDTLLFKVIGKGPGPVRIAMTPPRATVTEPERLRAPLLPRGPLLDTLGQSAWRRWPGRAVAAPAVNRALRAQGARARIERDLPERSRWGGSLGQRFDATGFFRVQHDGRRWWLVDPEGYPFWSAGMNCVRPVVETHAEGLVNALPSGFPPDTLKVDFLQANLARAFGADWGPDWARLALGQLRRLGFNTIGNWSDRQRLVGAGMPYVFELNVFFKHASPFVFRDFPDVFAPSFAQDAATLAAPLKATREDPALLGYFLMNEPRWAFAAMSPAEGMLAHTEACATREALGGFLRERYSTDKRLAQAWGMRVTYARLARGRWTRPFSPAAVGDLEAFSTVMVRRYFEMLLEACRRVDPHHINLGARLHSIPHPWAAGGMRGFDVFSINCYRDRLPAETEALAAELGAPLLIGEWHFGALDVGLPATGIQRVREQAARAQAYRRYLEHAVALPWCVGAHWFQMYDQSALGRFDGECCNIGFFDVCHRPYRRLAAAALASHKRLYALARGAKKPFDADVAYLKPLY